MAFSASQRRGFVLGRIEELLLLLLRGLRLQRCDVHTLMQVELKINSRSLIEWDTDRSAFIEQVDSSG